MSGEKRNYCPSPSESWVFTVLDIALASHRAEISRKAAANAFSVASELSKNARKEASTAQNLTNAAENIYRKAKKMREASEELACAAKNAAQTASVKTVYHAYTENVKELEKMANSLWSRIKKLLRKCVEDEIQQMDENIRALKKIETAFQDDVAPDCPSFRETLKRLQVTKTGNKTLEELSECSAFYALLYSIYAETRFMKIIHAPGEYQEYKKAKKIRYRDAAETRKPEKSEEEDELKLERAQLLDTLNRYLRKKVREEILKENSSLEDKWQRCFYYAFKWVDMDIPSEWTQFFDEYVKGPIEIRNKIAHGNWRFALDEKGTSLKALSTCKVQIGIMDSVYIHNLLKLYKEFAICLEKLMDGRDKNYAGQISDIRNVPKIKRAIKKLESETLIDKWRKMAEKRRPPVSISKVWFSHPDAVSFTVENLTADADALLSAYDEDGRLLSVDIVAPPKQGKTYQAETLQQGARFCVTLVSRGSFSQLCEPVILNRKT